MTGLSYTSDFKRTIKGSEEITRKTHKLSSRQRQFLLLIDKSDSLNQQICENLSQSIDVEQLINLGLLSTAEKVQSQEILVLEKVVEETQIEQKTEGKLEPLSSINITLADLPVVPKTELSLGEFSEIKEIMWSSLKKTSGLLAADLMMRIETSSQPEQLKRLTARWRTTMLETKYDKAEIQAWFDEVNSRLNG